VSVIDGPEGFFKPNELAPRAYLGNPIFHSQDKSCYADTCRPGEVEDDDPSFRPRVDFRLSFVRDPSYVFLTYVLVGWAFNMIAFSAFWFPRGSSVDRAGLSIGGIITAQFMLYDAKVTVKWVWLDTYLMVMLLFQFLCFALIMLSAHYDRHIPRGLGSFVTRSQKTPEGFGHSVPTTVKVIINNICRFIFGGKDTGLIDRLVRSCLVPIFFGVQIMQSFLPRSGGGSIRGRRLTGFNSPLFWLNFALLLGYVLVFLLAAVTGFKMAPLPGGRRHFGSMRGDGQREF